MRRILLFTVSLIISASALAQQKDIPFEKGFFKDRKSEFKTALKNYETGNGFFTGSSSDFGYPMYEKALEFYEPAYAFNPNSADLNFKMGICYINSLYKSKSLEFFQKAYALKNTVDPMIHFYIGWGLQLSYKWNEAKLEYEYYRKTLNQKDHLDQIMLVNKHIQECETGRILQEKPERVWIDNLGDAVNSKYPEYAPLISADESLLFFTSRRPDTQGGGVAQDDNRYFEDIYIATSKDGKWEVAKNLGSDVNGKSHDATAGLSPDGKILYVYLGAEGAGDIYQSNFEMGKYSKLKSLGKTINIKDAHETCAFLSFDGTQLYYVTDKPGGQGGHDIYMATWNAEKERWDEGVNLGPAINTKHDETGAFIHPDGRTIYFASKGHETMGGYDIFYSVRGDDGTWSKPKNLGYPVNTPDDDVHFVISASGRHGYYSSFRNDGKGEKDIYMITFLGPEKQPLLSGNDNLLASVEAPIKEVTVEPQVEVVIKNIAILKGFVNDPITQQPLKASIEVIDNEANTTIASFSSDDTDGSYMVTLPGGKNYGIAVKTDGYLFHSENFTLPEASGYREYKKDVLLKKVEVGESIVLKNIFYDYDKATLRPESKNELERLVKLLNDNPTIKIELSAHTDSRGSDSYNLDLSNRRAQSVVDYLITAGIAKDRLVAKGYGETKLIVTDADINALKTSAEKEEAHQENRRTEFKILSK
jgi:outer membrane protein OmpA-like peptidoglycan-associated protein/Tol biopolymer transport system component